MQTKKTYNNSHKNPNQYEPENNSCKPDDEQKGKQELIS